MGNYFDEVVLFLEENYVYVIGIGLIIILMLIGFLASRRKNKKTARQNEGMANINEVSTGSINDVANTLQSDVIQPVDIVSFPENNVKPEPQVQVQPEPQVQVQPEAPQFEQVPIAPPAESVDVLESQPNVTPEPMVTELGSFPTQEPVNDQRNSVPAEGAQVNAVQPEATPSPALNESPTNEAVNVTSPIDDNPKFVSPIAEDIQPVTGVDLEKTEVIDLSPLNETEITSIPKPDNEAPFVVDNSQYKEGNNLLNGDVGSTEEPRI